MARETAALSADPLMPGALHNQPMLETAGGHLSATMNPASHAVFHHNLGPWVGIRMFIEPLKASQNSRSSKFYGPET